MKIILIAATLLITSCGLLGKTEQTQEASQAVRAPMTAQAEVVEQTITQDTNQNQNATSGGNQVESKEIGNVITTNYGNIDFMTLLTILACFAAFNFLFGLLIPQPRFIKWFF
jgi:hypothetical protein